ncbi:MAG: hypothetical protein IKA01_09990 [Alistipes sp.]|nr:hypothetical protein [Alistipes sp.]
MVSYFPQEINPTFNVPDLYERVPMGVWVGGSLGYMDDGQLPRIYGTVDTGVGHGHSTGAFYQSSTHTYAGLYANTNYVSTFDASRCSSAYSRGDNFVIPRRLNVNYVIKY